MKKPEIIEALRGLKIGDTLWFVPLYQASPYAVTVKSIARVYLYTTLDHKIRLSDLREVVDGMGERGQAYLSEEAYLTKVELDEKWQSLRYKIGYNPTLQNITAAQIELAARLLGIDLGDKK